jgi:hypothetical protein
MNFFLFVWVRYFSQELIGSKYEFYNMFLVERTNDRERYLDDVLQILRERETRILFKIFVSIKQLAMRCVFSNKRGKFYRKMYLIIKNRDPSTYI